MKVLKFILIIIVTIIFLWGLFNIIREKQKLKNETTKFQAELDSLAKENKYLKSRIEYLQVPENLLKEVKAETNVKKPEEKLIIIVSPKATSTR